MALIFLISSCFRVATHLNKSAYGRYWYQLDREADKNLPLAQRVKAVAKVVGPAGFIRTTLVGTAPPLRNAHNLNPLEEVQAPRVDVDHEAGLSRALRLLRDIVGSETPFIDQFPNNVSTLTSEKSFLKATKEEIQKASQAIHSHPDVVAANVVLILGYRPDSHIGGLIFRSGFFRKSVGECDIVQQLGPAKSFAIYLISIHPGLIFYQYHILSSFCQRILLLIAAAVEELGGGVNDRLDLPMLNERVSRYRSGETYKEIRRLAEVCQDIWDADDSIKDHWLHSTDVGPAVDRAVGGGGAVSHVRGIGNHLAATRQRLNIAARAYPDFNLKSEEERKQLIEAAYEENKREARWTYAMRLWGERTKSKIEVPSGSSSIDMICLICGAFQSKSVCKDESCTHSFPVGHPGGCLTRITLGLNCIRWHRTEDGRPAAFTIQQSVFWLFLASLTADTYPRQTVLSSFLSFLRNENHDFVGKAALQDRWRRNAAEKLKKPYESLRNAIEKLLKMHVSSMEISYSAPKMHTRHPLRHSIAEERKGRDQLDENENLLKRANLPITTKKKVRQLVPPEMLLRERDVCKTVSKEL
ncbi:hypothetical protein BC829DRAFT_435718 [Chytridium lagenaria]|nr:hypothetical protein BC829DRAFT_435718 [Chytridium lagenaria]